MSNASHRANATLKHRQRLQRERERRIDDFAELLAEGFTSAAASRALGVSQQNGSTMLAEIRHRLGIPSHD